MKPMIDWTQLTDDPVNNDVRTQVVEYLLGIRAPLPNNDCTTYLTSEVKGQEVLDIGVCEHTMERMKSPEWKHRIIFDNATNTMGVDILDDLVKTLNQEGFNIVGCDAT